mgnify:CR=1 FL=1
MGEVRESERSAGMVGWAERCQSAGLRISLGLACKKPMVKYMLRMESLLFYAIELRTHLTLPARDNNRS